MKELIGFIGQGYVGKNYANDLEARGYATVRYSLEEPYRQNKDKIKDCDVVFIGVPTPTTPKGFDASIVREALGLVGAGRIALIKSTILPGTTAVLQKECPDITILYSPEFLSETTAAYDAAHPFSNIIGIAAASERHRQAAAVVHSILPPAPFSFTCASTEAEVIKYAHNASGYVQIVLFNIIYDLAEKVGCDWSNIHQAIVADPLISNRYAQPMHKSGRGAGGNCFIKDFAAWSELYDKLVGDELGKQLLKSMQQKNIDLLAKSGKDLNLLKGVYGEEAGK